VVPVFHAPEARNRVERFRGKICNALRNDITRYDRHATCLVKFQNVISVAKVDRVAEIIYQGCAHPHGGASEGEHPNSTAYVANGIATTGKNKCQVESHAIDVGHLRASELARWVLGRNFHQCIANCAALAIAHHVRLPLGAAQTLRRGVAVR
jgi:hypothetical protein